MADTHSESLLLARAAMRKRAETHDYFARHQHSAADGLLRDETLLVLDTLDRYEAALEDIAAARREFDLTPQGEQFDFVESFWFLVRLAEGAKGDV